MTSLHDKIGSVILSREYGKLPILLENIHSGDHREIEVELSTPYEVIQSLRRAGLRVKFRQGYSYQGWQDIPQIIKNSPLPHLLHMGDPQDLVTMIYCQIGRIPYTLSHSGIYCGSSVIHNMAKLNQADVNMLDHRSKSLLAVLADHNQLEFMIKMLKESGYSWNSSFITRDRSWSRTLHQSLSWLPGVNTLNSVRASPTNREFSLDPIFDSQWRRMTPEQIVDLYFNVNHLIRLGIELPHIDLILNKLGYMSRVKWLGSGTFTHTNECDLLGIKQLIHHSTPSSAAITRLLEGLDASHERLGAILVIFQHRPEVMTDYKDHPLIKHLFEISPTRNMKSAQTA